MTSNRLVIYSIAAALFGLGAAIRLTDLEINPPGLWQDEASTGVDAYLIWTTGKDRAGAVYPIISRSFGDYPLALYRYLDAPIVGLLGLTIRNQRVVAALAGTLLLAFVALVMRRRFDDLTACCMLMVGALSPTWIHFSRYGSEAILMPAALVLGWLLIELGAKRSWLIWMGAVSLAASAYTYHAVKIFLPLWLLGFLLYQWPLVKQLWRERRVHLIGPALLFAVLVMPSVWVAFSPEGRARGDTVAAWKHADTAVDVTRMMMNNYLSYFDPGMLFVRGGPAVAQSIPYLGLWNLIELPLLIIALVHIARSERNRTFVFLLFWFLLGPVPGGITYESQNIGRAIGWIPAPQMLSAIGLAILVRTAWHTRPSAARTTALAAIVVAWLGTTYWVTKATFSIYPRLTQRDWQWDISGPMKCAKEKRGDRKLIVSPAFHMVSLFATFHFTGLPWELGERETVAPNELYLFPVHRPKPKSGQELCTIVIQSNGATVSYVYEAASK